MFGVIISSLSSSLRTTAISLLSELNGRIPTLRKCLVIPFISIIIRLAPLFINLTPLIAAPYANAASSGDSA